MLKNFFTRAKLRAQILIYKIKTVWVKFKSVIVQRQTEKMEKKIRQMKREMALLESLEQYYLSEEDDTEHNNG